MLFGNLNDAWSLIMLLRLYQYITSLYQSPNLTEGRTHIVQGEFTIIPIPSTTRQKIFLHFQ